MSKQKSAFTLMETLLAIAVVAILLTTFLAVFGPATTGIRRAVSVQDADRLASALEQELKTLRESEQGTYQNSFEKAFDWVSSSSNPSNAIILFNYRGDTSNVQDGEMQPYTGDTGLPGQDYLLQSAVRRLGDPSSNLQELLEAVDGRVFAVRLRQLVRQEDGSLGPAASGSGLVDSEGQSASSADQFNDAVIACQAEFYLLPANTYAYLTGPFSAESSFDNLDEPLFTRPMGFLR